MGIQSPKRIATFNMDLPRWRAWSKQRQTCFGYFFWEFALASKKGRYSEIIERSTVWDGDTLDLPGLRRRRCRDFACGLQCVSTPRSCPDLG